MFRILLHAAVKNGKYLVSIMDNSVIICDEVIDVDVDAEAKSCDKAKCNNEETKTVPTNFIEKNITYKIQNFYISLAFLLITIALLIAVSICCYMIKYRGKQKHLLAFQFTNNKLKEIIY